MTPAQQRRLRRQALIREKRAERLEASARRYLRDASLHRRAAKRLRLISGCVEVANKSALNKETPFRQDWVFLYYMRLGDGDCCVRWGG